MIGPHHSIICSFTGTGQGAAAWIAISNAMMQALPLDAVFVERGVSGSKPLGERPEGARLLAALKAVTQ
jgi:hypothetical protein